MFFHATKCCFFFSGELPHKKVLNNFSSFSRVVAGSIIVLMVCVGKAESTAIVSVNLPTKLKVIPFHPGSRDETLSTVSSKVSLLIHCNIGIPRYLPRSNVTPIPLSSLICLASSRLTFPEKKILYFSKLAFCPDATQNLSRTRRIMRTCATDASPNRIKSSAKQICDSCRPPRDSRIGFHSPFPIDASIR
ncbi:unnamed protein product [Cochlearia groenlandica]